MKYTRKIRIEKKIITEKDLKELARVIVEEGEKSEGKVKLELYYKGGLSESGEGISVFEKSIFFGKHVLEGVLFSLEDEIRRQEILVQLEHGNDGDNYITIEGEDPDWVNGKVTQFEDIIRNWKKRYFWIFFGTWDYIQYLIFFLYLVIGFMFLGMTKFPELSLHEREMYALRSIFYAVATVISMKEIGRIWPLVELDVHPSRLSAQRKFVSGVIATVLFGVVSSAIYDLIKKF